MSKTSRITLRNKLLFFLLLFASAPIIAFSYWTLQVLNTNAEESVLESLAGLAKTKAQAIETYAQSRLHNIEKLAALSDIVGNMKQLVVEPQPTASTTPQKLDALEKEGGGLPQSVAEKRSEESERPAKPKSSSDIVREREGAQPLPAKSQQALAALKKSLTVILADQKEYEEILIITPDGVVLASTFDGHEQKTAQGIDYFQNGLKATFFQHVFVSSITEKLTMVISTPIRDETGNVLGVFAARLNLDQLFRMVEDLSGLRRTGETIVAKETAEGITFMAPTRHDYKAALSRTIEIGSEQLKPLQEATRGDSGAGRLLDYRNELCLAAWEYIPTLKWGIMVKMDRDEAIQPYMEAQYKTILLALVILFIGVLLAVYLANALVRPIKELQEAADRISKGDMNVKISIFSQDEIGDLADSFGRMIAAIKFLLEEKDRRVEE